MNAKLTFLGAARNVTGSRHLLECDGERVLVDCGLYQERAFADRNWDSFPVPPASVGAVLLTHGHLDHCGWLPRFVRDGFAGEVHCTEATADIAGIVLRDAAKVQEEDAAFKQRRHAREGRVSPRPVVPLYTAEDAEQAIRRLQPHPYGRAFALAGGFEAEFREAGHILGSASILVRFGRNAAARSVLFSGDIGRCHAPILRDPDPAPQADYIVVESTYGDRLHESEASIPDRLAEVVNRTWQAGGNLLIPSFAIERTQEVLYHLSGLLRAKRIRRLPVFVDSPMAVRVTEVFRRHSELFDAETQVLLRRHEHPCDFPGLMMSQTSEQSKAINQIRGTAVIIAGSGMCNAGRIKHHLAHNISRPECTVLFVGFQAMGTLGRILLDGARTVRILGAEHEVRAGIERVSGFSAHADRNELSSWLAQVDPAPRRAFVVHGEPETAESFARYLTATRGWQTEAPEYGASAILG